LSFPRVRQERSSSRPSLAGVVLLLRLLKRYVYSCVVKTRLIACAELEASVNDEKGACQDEHSEEACDCCQKSCTSKEGSASEEGCSGDEEGTDQWGQESCTCEEGDGGIEKDSDFQGCEQQEYKHEEDVERKEY
jgi:hypothetical protein